MALVAIYCLISTPAYLISRATLSDDATDDTHMQLHQKLTPDMGEPLANPTCYRELDDACLSHHLEA